MENLICKECQREFNDYTSLRKHRSMKHKISSEQTYIEYKLAGQEPECKCGCHERPKFLGDTAGFREYRWGHAAKVCNNWGNNPNFKELKRKSAETQHKLHQEGKLKIWNKGLTIDDERVKNNIEKVLLSPTRSKRISDKLKDKVKTDLHKQHLRESQIKSWDNPDKREKQSHTRIQHMVNNGCVVKSKLEEHFIKILEMNFNMIEHEHYYRQYYIREIKSLFDFKITHKKILIEIDGDYWHCNPATKFVTPIYAAQKKNLIQDQIKNQWCENNNFTLLRFWETDINKNPDMVIAKLKEYLG